MRAAKPTKVSERLREALRDERDGAMVTIVGYVFLVCFVSASFFPRAQSRLEIAARLISERRLGHGWSNSASRARRASERVGLIAIQSIGHKTAAPHRLSAPVGRKLGTPAEKSVRKGFLG